MSPSSVSSLQVEAGIALLPRRGGGTVYVRGGTYELDKTLNINRSGASDAERTVICSYPGETAKIVGTGDDNTVNIGASFVTLSGLDISQASPDTKGKYGILIWQQHHVTVTGCTIHHLRDSGIFPRNVSDWPESVWRRVIDGFKELAAAAKTHGVTLNLESTFDSAELIRIVDGVGSDAIRVYYDTSNHTEFGHDVPAEMRKLGKLINMIHAKDYHNKMLGEGSVDFAGVDAAIREIGFDGWIVLETPTGDDPAAANAQNLEFIRKLGR